MSDRIWRFEYANSEPQVLVWRCHGRRVAHGGVGQSNRSWGRGSHTLTAGISSRFGNKQSTLPLVNLPEESMTLTIAAWRKR